jgi:diadenosine tetraphosphate (Ap4A) HIT family hydrolase
LQNDARWPWMVLVPRVEAARELEDLSDADRMALMGEVVRAGGAVRALGEALAWPVAKLNVGLLGNVTPQLHAHVVGRRPGDAAWPGPVWGVGAAEPYSPLALERALAAARGGLDL